MTQTSHAAAREARRALLAELEALAVAAERELKPQGSCHLLQCAVIRLSAWDLLTTAPPMTEAMERRLEAYLEAGRRSTTSRPPSR